MMILRGLLVLLGRSVGKKLLPLRQSNPTGQECAIPGTPLAVLWLCIFLASAVACDRKGSKDTTPAAESPKRPSPVVSAASEQPVAVAVPLSKSFAACDSSEDMALDTQAVVVGPLEDHEAAIERLRAILHRQNLKLTTFERSQRGMEGNHRVAAWRANGTWLALPISIAGHFGGPAFVTTLDYDPENEWGNPIGYSIHEVCERAGRLYLGARQRQELSSDTDPDEGARDGDVDEVQRQSASGTAPKETDLFTTLVSTLGTPLLDRILYRTLAGNVAEIRETADGMFVDTVLDGGGASFTLKSDEAQRLTKAYSELSGRTLSEDAEAGSKPRFIEAR